MTHSFHAYIDESGDDGFIFLDPPARASSQWFVLGALVLREKNQAPASRKLGALFGPIEEAKKSPVHFARLPHEQQSALCSGLAKLPVRAVVIAIDKRSLKPGHTLEGNRRLYSYCVRFLFERISWITRDEHVAGEGNGRCRLTFSHCKGLSYERLAGYIDHIKDMPTQVAWDHLDTEKYNVKAHGESLWLRAADVMTSGIAKGLELSRYGLCEDRFARQMKPIVYERKGNYGSYGLKLFPSVPAVEVERDNRYEWLSLYKLSGG